jgi:hypothetical protein
MYRTRARQPGTAHSIEPATSPQRPALQPIGHQIVSQTSISTPHLSDDLSRDSVLMSSSHTSYQPRTVTTSRRQALGTIQSQGRAVSRAIVSHSTDPRVVSRPLNNFPYMSTQPHCIVARIANAISSLSAVLLSPESDLLPSFTGVVPAAQGTPGVVAVLPHSTSQVDLDIFSTAVDTECCTCFEPQKSMRRLIVWKHMSCEEYLSKQVCGPYPRAHDCPLCWKEDMFEGTDWETY